MEGRAEGDGRGGMVFFLWWRGGLRLVAQQVEPNKMLVDLLRFQRSPKGTESPIEYQNRRGEAERGGNGCYLLRSMVTDADRCCCCCLCFIRRK